MRSPTKSGLQFVAFNRNEELPLPLNKWFGECPYDDDTCDRYYPMSQYGGPGKCESSIFETDFLIWKAIYSRIFTLNTVINLRKRIGAFGQICDQ